MDLGADYDAAAPGTGGMAAQRLRQESGFGGEQAQHQEIAV
jgi:hypothetical protein